MITCVSCGGPVDDPREGEPPVCSWWCQVEEMARHENITPEEWLKRDEERNSPDAISAAEEESLALLDREIAEHELNRMAYHNQYVARRGPGRL